MQKLIFWFFYLHTFLQFLDMEFLQIIFLEFIIKVKIFNIFLDMSSLTASIIDLFLMIFGDFHILSKISKVYPTITSIFVFGFSLTVKYYYIYNVVFYAFCELAEWNYYLLVP